MSPKLKVCSRIVANTAVLDKGPLQNDEDCVLSPKADLIHLSVSEPV